MVNRKKICRFCFEKCDANFRAIEKSTHEILNRLLITTNLAISDGPVMCTNCSEILQNCFVFKKTCLDVRAHSKTVAFGNDKNSSCVTCEFCMNQIKKSSFTTLDIEDLISEKAMLDKYFPELVLSTSQKPVICEVCLGSLVNFFSFVTISSIIEERIKEYCQAKDVSNTKPLKLSSVLKFTSRNFWKENDNVFKMENTISVKSEQEGIDIIKTPVVCAFCHGSVEGCFHFLMNCLSVGETIKKHRETPDISSESKIEPSSSLQLAVRDVTTREVDGNSVHTIKIEEQFCEERKSLDAREIDGGADAFKLEQIFAGDNKDAIKYIEDKNKSFMETNDQEVNNEQCTPRNMLPPTGEDKKLGSIKIEEIICGKNETENEEVNLVEREGQKMLLNEEIEIKTDEQDFNKFEDGIVSSQLVVIRRSLDRGRKCSVLKHTMTKNHLIRHKKSHANHDLIFKDLPVHRDPSEVAMYNCESCSFQARNKYCFKIHLLTHKHPPEVKMYKCDVCLYQTKYKSQLKRHLILHKDPPEVIMYECDSCLFRTRYKKSLIYHCQTHRDPSRVIMHKCDICSYQTKLIYDLKKHVIIHKDPSEVTMHKCDYCSYQTKRKDCLRDHVLRHKDPSEVTVYKCESCSFQTKVKRFLTRHLILHKNSSEVTTYKCDSCLFQTKHKKSLKDHFLLLHKDPSEVTMYKCDFCLYQTKLKNQLRSHLILHKNPSEVIMYQCDSCSFQTKHRGSIKDHVLTHKDPSEVIMYKCDTCLYQSKFKYELKKHMILHKSPAEVTMHKCDSCSFQTKHKDSLRDHVLTHKAPSEVIMHKCDHCSYQTKVKRSLRKHMLFHKHPSEVTMHKCESCSFQSKYRRSLVQHLLRHKDPSGIPMHKCGSCSFQTKCKYSLKKHKLTHKNPQK